MRNLLVALIAIMALLPASPVGARDDVRHYVGQGELRHAQNYQPWAWSIRDDGRYAGSPLKEWFNGLASGNGLCCSFADGVSIEDADWDTLGSTANDGSGLRVRIEGVWFEVPNKAVITEPNKLGSAVVWPFKSMDGVTHIRCFMPGSGA